MNRDIIEQDIKSIINKKIEGLSKDIQARMDGLDEFIELILSIGEIKDIDGCIDFLIGRQVPKDEKDVRFLVCTHTNSGGQIYQKEKAVYDYLKVVFDELNDDEKFKNMQELMTMIKCEQTNIPTIILKYLVLKIPDSIEFATKNGRSYLSLGGFEIASMTDEEQPSPNCQDFSFVKVTKGLRGLGLGDILLHNYLKLKYLENENNKNYTIRAYGVASDNIIAQNLYSKFGAKFIDENGNILTQEQFAKTGKHLFMLFDNNTLKSIVQKDVRPFMTYEGYLEKQNATNSKETSERAL